MDGLLCERRCSAGRRTPLRSYFLGFRMRFRIAFFPRSGTTPKLATHSSSCSSMLPFRCSGCARRSFLAWTLPRTRWQRGRMSTKPKRRSPCERTRMLAANSQGACQNFTPLYIIIITQMQKRTQDPSDFLPKKKTMVSFGTTETSAVSKK